MSNVFVVDNSLILGHRPYVVSIFMQATAVMKRRLQIIRGELPLHIINIIAFVCQAILLGTRT